MNNEQRIINNEQAMINAEKIRNRKILKVLIPITLIVIILAAIAVIMANKAGNKTPVSSSEFMESASQNGCAVASIKEQLGKDEMFVSASAAQIDEDNAVHYFEFKRKADAKSYFAVVARGFKNDAKEANVSNAEEKELENYCYYSANVNGKYLRVVRVKNTVIWANVDDVHTTVVKKIIAAIGY